MATASILLLPTLSVSVIPSLVVPHTLDERRLIAAQHGQALKMLSRAVDYLIDSRFVEGGLNGSESEAVALLRKSSRTVFEQNLGLAPIRRPFGTWAHALTQRCFTVAASI